MSVTGAAKSANWSPIDIAASMEAMQSRGDIEVDRRGGPTTGPFYEDAEGFNMPLAPATGNRRIPFGDFPTGPEVGSRLPDIIATDPTGGRLDVHADRDGHPAVVVFYRSAVW